MDPIEFRLRNAAKQGTRRLDGPVNPRIGAVETLKRHRRMITTHAGRRIQPWPGASRWDSGLTAADRRAALSV